MIVGPSVMYSKVGADGASTSEGLQVVAKQKCQKAPATMAQPKNADLIPSATKP